MEYIGKAHPDTKILLGRPEDFAAFALAPVNAQNLADRVAAVLDERRRIGEERRKREREYLLRKTERTQEGERRRGEPKGSVRRLMELDSLCEVVCSSNAANEAMKEHGIPDAS
jgi:hypothetical protein